MLKKLTEAQQMIVEQNMNLSYFLIHKYFSKYGEDDDVKQVAMIGLCKAASYFNPNYGTEFSTYAANMIIGEIKRHLRDYIPMRVPRPIKDTYYKIYNVQKDCNRELTSEELSKILNIPCKKIDEALNSKNEPLIFSTQVYHSNGTDILLEDNLNDERVNVEEEVIKSIDTQNLINKVLGIFSKKEKIVLEKYYLENKTQVQVSKEVGLSQAQVSRILKKVIERAKIATA